MSVPLAIYLCAGTHNFLRQLNTSLPALKSHTEIEKKKPYNNRLPIESIKICHCQRQASTSISVGRAKSALIAVRSLTGLIR